MHHYAHLTNKVDRNYYLVSNDSLLDAPTYQCIMDGMDASYALVDNHICKNVEQIFQTDERFINPEKASTHFLKLLSPYIQFNTKIKPSDIDPLDCSMVLDCTNNHLFPHPDFHYEQTLSLIYQKKSDSKLTGYTFVDGPCGSLYPFDISRRLYSLTHVTWTSVQKCKEWTSSMNTIEDSELGRRQNAMEQYIQKHLPDFSKEYSYHSHFLSLKCKPNKSSCDSRECFVDEFVQNDVPVVRVICGKITGIFEFEKYVQNKLSQQNFELDIKKKSI